MTKKEKKKVFDRFHSILVDAYKIEKANREGRYYGYHSDADSVDEVARKLIGEVQLDCSDYEPTL